MSFEEVMSIMDQYIYGKLNDMFDSAWLVYQEGKETLKEQGAYVHALEKLKERIKLEIDKYKERKSEKSGN